MNRCTCDPRQPGIWCAWCEQRIDAAQDREVDGGDCGDGPWEWVGGAA